MLAILACLQLQSALSKTIPMALLSTCASHYVICMFTFMLQLHLLRYTL